MPGLARRLFNALRASSDGGESDDRSAFGDFWFTPVGTRVSAGVRVTPETALRLSAVFACVRLIAETFSTLPFELYRKKSSKRTQVTNHWIVPLFTRRPNPFQNAFEWREMLQGHLALRGNCYNFIESDGRGQITALTPIHPDAVKVKLINAEGTDYRYVVTDRTGRSLPYSRDQIWHLRGLSSDGVLGMSPISLARESIGLGLAAQDYGARFFANDASPSSGWVENPGYFKDKSQRESFRESFQKVLGGVNRGKVAIFERGMKWHEVSVHNNDAQFLETRKFQVNDIARIFRVPPHMIADLERATNNNIEQMSLEFIKYCMTPWVERWEASIEADLLLDGIDDGLEISFDFDRLARGDSAARANFYQSGINTGWLTRNEARAAESLDPIDGLDEPLRPLNEVPNDQEPATNPQAPGAKPGTPPPPINQRQVPGKKPAPELPAPQPAPPKKSRQLALEAAAIERIARKEMSALGRGIAPETVFDGKHANFVAEVLAISSAAGLQYCEARLRGVEALPLLEQLCELDCPTSVTTIHVQAPPRLELHAHMAMPITNNIAPPSVSIEAPISNYIEPARSAVKTVVSERQTNGTIVSKVTEQ
jgi:HK97 family phage portal protein